MILNFLFPQRPNDINSSLLLLAARIIVGILLMTHGLQKIENYENLSQSFPDLLSVGSNISLCLAIFGEVVCSIAFILGLLYRLAMIPMIFTMSVAFFVIHGGDPFTEKELPFVYLIIFIILYISGPDRYSIDSIIGAKLKKKTKSIANLTK